MCKGSKTQSHFLSFLRSHAPNLCVLLQDGASFWEERKPGTTTTEPPTSPLVMEIKSLSSLSSRLHAS